MITQTELLRMQGELMEKLIEYQISRGPHSVSWNVVITFREEELT